MPVNASSSGQALECHLSLGWATPLMAVHNADIAAIFNRLADLLEIEGANPFRVRAYRRAAQTIEDLPSSAAEMARRGADLSQLPSIGKDLAGKIQEIVETGRLGVPSPLCASPS
jgi:DNA polymerase (family 10)